MGGASYHPKMAGRDDQSRLKHELEELFADLCQVPRLVAPRRGFRPAIDVFRAEDPPRIDIVVELAGVDPGEIDLSFADSVLTIRGKRRRSAGQGHHFQHMEIDYGTFERRVAISDPIDVDAVKASYDRGLLLIELPVAERMPKRVRVRITAGKIS